jgi:hypothetical protein
MKWMALLALVALAAFFATERYGAGRRYWHPYYVALAGGRSHEEVLRDIGPGCRARLRDAASSVGLPYPPSRLTIVGLKEEKALEVWGPSGSGWTLMRTYAVLAASGGVGPKLREGDLQVPEGVYRLIGFNPRSSYHLSIRVDYPNADDRAAARIDGRTNLGGDIFIHGKAVSIGCLALGDAAIEEVYTFVADVGLARSRLLLVPNAAPQAAPGSPAWVARLYERLRNELRAVRGTPARST